MLTDIAPYLALAALVAAVALTGAALWLARRQSDLVARQEAVLGQDRARDVVEFVLELETQVDNLREAVTILTEEVEHYRHDLDAALSNIAVVRFDAFPDTGGEQSASIALLDSYRSGLVVSILASRESARLYVKFLDHGLPDRELSPEESAAVTRAVPTPLPRGELSRPPVSTFSREVRRTIEAARQAAAAASDAAGVATAALGEPAVGEPAAPGDALEAPAAAFPADDRANDDWRWTETPPSGPGEVPAAAGTLVASRHIGPTPDDDVAANASPAAGQTDPDTVRPATPTRGPDTAGPDGPGPLPGGRAAAARPEDEAGSWDRTPPGPGDAAPRVSEAPDAAVGEGEDERADRAESADEIRRRRHEDWLGGEDLDF